MSTLALGGDAPSPTPPDGRSSPVPTVSEILDKRRRAGELPISLSGLVSFLLHGSFVVALFLISKPRPVADIPPSVPVTIVSGGQLRRSRAVPVPDAPPKPAEPPKAKPVIEKPKEEVLPETKQAMPLPDKPKKPEPKPVVPAGVPKPAETSSAPAEEIDVPAPESGVEGPGSSSFGTSVSSLDADFPYSYYVEQFLQLIGANWFKPEVQKGTVCVVFFKILRSGQITDIKVEQPSGLAFYDREATRSLYKANPLPPLPPEYPGEYLGVHLRFQ